MKEIGTYVLTRKPTQLPPRQAGKLPFGRIDMELTERCNLNCIHCCINLPAGDREAQRQEIPTDKVKNILRQAATLGSLTVRFTGGEPLLREDFPDLYVFARKLGLKVLIFTNATLFTPALSDLFSRVPPLEKIEVTVYGMRRISYEAVTRVSGSFEAARRGVHLLLENKIPFAVKGAWLPPNKGEMEEFESWGRTIPWMDRPPAYSLFFDLRSRRDGKKNGTIRRLRATPEEGAKILSRGGEGYLREMKEFCSKFIGPRGDRLFTCGSGHAPCVDAYGHLQPCMLLRHPDMIYNLRNGSLEDALGRFFPDMRETRTTNSDYLNRCGKCFLKGLCEQCPGKAWAEHGTLDTPVDYLCQVAHAQARTLGLLRWGEKAWEIANWSGRLKKFLEREN